MENSRLADNLVNLASHDVKTLRAAVITIVQDETTHKVEQLLEQLAVELFFFLVFNHLATLTLSFPSVFFI